MTYEPVDETEQAESEPFYASFIAKWRANHPLEADEAYDKARGYSSLEEMEEVRASGMTDEEYFGKYGDLCGLCLMQSPEFFHVPDKEWQKYVIPPLQEGILCRKCYEKQKKLFPNGWRKSNMPYKLVDETEQGKGGAQGKLL